MSNDNWGRVGWKSHGVNGGTEHEKRRIYHIIKSSPRVGVTSLDLETGTACQYTHIRGHSAQQKVAAGAGRQREEMLDAGSRAHVTSCSSGQRQDQNTGCPVTLTAQNAPSNPGKAKTYSIRPVAPSGEYSHFFAREVHENTLYRVRICGIR